MQVDRIQRHLQHGLLTRDADVVVFRLYFDYLGLRAHDQPEVVLDLRVILVGARYFSIGDLEEGSLAHHRLERVNRFLVGDALDHVSASRRLVFLALRHVDHIELEDAAPVRAHHNGLELLMYEALEAPVCEFVVGRSQAFVLALEASGKIIREVLDAILAALSHLLARRRLQRQLLFGMLKDESDAVHESVINAGLAILVAQRYLNDVTDFQVVVYELSHLN